MALFAGTSSGVYAVNAGQARLVGLQRHLITHLAAGQGSLLAAVPVRGPVHDMNQLPSEDGQQPGLHATAISSSGLETKHGWKHVWEGDARSCGVAPGVAPGTWLVGTEPADVFHSSDEGASWHGSNGFRDIPSRSTWSFPAPPHQPHVLSIEAFQPPSGGGPLQVVAGIEVGGALLSTDGGNSWEERNTGLYEDVHSCRVDPHNDRRWYAVTGRGLYKTEDGGGQWQKLMQDLPRWYTIGLALNPEREGEVLVTGGDRPPSVGVHVAHSSDGGATWLDITQSVYNGSNTAEAKGRYTPVPYFFQGQALLGTDTGYVLCLQAADRRQWGVLCRLPHPVLCMAGQGQSPSSMMH